MYPILFKLGPITIYSYGVSVALGFIAAGFLIIKRSPDYGISKEKIWDLLFCIFISGIIGARLLHVFLNLEYYRKDMIEIIMLHKGGLAIQGAVIASMLATAVFLLKNNLSFWKTGDLVMQYLPLGQAIGRIGCFLNGCCYGKGNHPTQLYSSIALLIIFVALRLFSRKKMRFDGEIFLFYFIIYSSARFFIDFLRGDLSPILCGLTASQLISITFFFIAVSVYLFRANEKNSFKS